jgi:hypothetical protein
MKTKTPKVDKVAKAKPAELEEEFDVAAGADDLEPLSDEELTPEALAKVIPKGSSDYLGLSDDSVGMFLREMKSPRAAPMGNGPSAS